MKQEEIEKQAKETSGGNYYYEQGFIYGFELGEENGRKEVTYMKAEEYDKYLNACRENEILEKENEELKANLELEEGRLKYWKKHYKYKSNDVIELQKENAELKMKLLTLENKGQVVTTTVSN